MKNKFYLVKIVLFLILFSPLNFYAQFNSAYGLSVVNDATDYSTSFVEATPGGGLITQGVSYTASNPTNGDVVLLKTDLNGNILWQKYYDIASTSQFTSTGSMIQLSSGAMFTVGSNTGNGGFILKTDNSGTVFWVKKIVDSSSGSGFKCIKKTADGNLIAVGCFQNKPTVIKFDVNGTILFQKKLVFSASLSDFSTSISQTTDGGYLISSALNFSPQLASVVKLDASGNLVWSKLYNAGSVDFINSIYATTDGGGIFTGSTVINGIQYATVVKLDASGNITWKNLFQSSLGRPNGIFIRQITTGEYLYSMTIVDPSNGNYSKAYILKLSSSGSTIWSKSTPSRIINDFQPLSDGNYGICGQTPYGIDNWGATFDDIYLAKVSSSGVNCATLDFSFQNGTGITVSSQTCTVSTTSLSLVSATYSTGNNTYIATTKCLCTANAGPDQANYFNLCCTPENTSVVIGTAPIGGYSYAWSPSYALSCTNCAQPSASPNGTTSYTMTVNSNSCIKNTDVVTVTTLTGLPCDCGGQGRPSGRLSSPDSSQYFFKIFPNPAQNSFNITVDNTIKNGVLNIYDVSGKLVMTQNLTDLAPDKSLQVDVSPLKKGIYSVEIKTDSSSFSDNLIIN